ncbi:MAG: BatA domain-containing protein, partial [Thermoleophilia bacterium]|nr:BatA domain-containing protein [Thermoleophilia bacterium]
MEPPIVLALGLANAPLIYGLAAASVPIIIHLLNRRRYREVPWAAMRFLLAAVRKNQRRVKIEQWLLLAIRTLIIVLVVTAMAKPFLESLGAVPVLAGQRTHRVLVLDGSLSMATAEGDRTRFEQAKELAGKIVEDARRGDAISLVLLADPPKVVIGAPSPNHDEVRRELGELDLPHGGTDLAAGFEAIDRVLDASDIPQKDVIILTDLQASSWRPDGRGPDDGLKRILSKIEARKVRSVVIDLGKAGLGNRAVVGLSLNTPVATAGTPLLVRGVLHNYGPSRAEGVEARLVIDGQVGPSETVDLPVGEDTPVVFNHTFAAPGDHLVEILIEGDALKLDDRRSLAVPVREQVQVLLVDGHFKSEPYQAETDYLAQALSPESTSEGAPSTVKVDVVPEGRLAGRDLTPYDTVVLANVPQFNEAEVAGLEDYLKQGGGVVIFGGDQVLPDNYNRLLFADGKGLLPASIGASVGDAAKREASVTFDGLGFKHPIVAPFAGESDPVQAGLTATKTYQYHKLALPAGSRARVALAFSNGDPAIVESPRHRGTVVLVATSADSGWTTWPLHNSYPPVMEAMIMEAAAGRLAERNVRVGQPLQQSLPAAAVAAPVSVTVPGGAVVPSKL